MFAEETPSPYTIATHENKQVLMIDGYIYKKTIGRAYRSYWICITDGCTAQVKLNELKGGSLNYLSKHREVCLPNQYKYVVIQDQEE